MHLSRENAQLLAKLAVVAAGMFAFGYALVPLYQRICEATGINILALAERPDDAPRTLPANSQIDASRRVTVEFDANVQGLWHFKPAQRTMQVHPGELATVMYEFENVQARRINAQAIPGYAPRQAARYFNKLECFCFTQYTLEPGEKRQWPVVFVIDPNLPGDVGTITLSYTFFEIGGQMPATPAGYTPAVHSTSTP